MRSVVYLVSALFFSSSVLAVAVSGDQGSSALRARHAHKQHAHHLGRDLKVTANSRLTKRSPKKRCKAKSSSTSELATATSTTKPAATSSNDSSDNGSSSSSSSAGNIGGILPAGTYGSKCQSDATKDTTNTSGPNGAAKFLACGLDGAGWKPPTLKMEQLHFGDLDNFRSTTFKPCSSDAIAAFKKYGAKYNIAPIILASFAMQESTCNLSTTGNGGEVGMFQLSPDKCKGRSSSACRELDFQADTAASYFRDRIDANGGNVVKAAGEYNGWSDGMTVAKVKAMGKCCEQNMDYLHQTMNAWWQGKTGYNYGTYKNV